MAVRGAAYLHIILEACRTSLALAALNAASGGSGAALSVDGAGNVESEVSRSTLDLAALLRRQNPDPFRSGTTLAVKNDCENLDLTGETWYNCNTYYVVTELPISNIAPRRSCFWDENKRRQGGAKGVCTNSTSTSTQCKDSKHCSAHECCEKKMDDKKR